MLDVSIITFPVAAIFVLVTVFAIACRNKLWAKHVFESQVKNELVLFTLSVLLSAGCIVAVLHALHERAVWAGGRYSHHDVLLASHPVAFWFWTMLFYFYAVLMLVTSVKCIYRIMKLRDHT
jgi:hypothetical protein